MRVGTTTFVTCLSLALSLLAAACVVAEDEPGPPDENLQAAEDAMVFSITTQHRIDRDSVTVGSIGAETFPDSCLGIPMEDSCAQVQTPGYQLTLEIRGETYQYRAPATEPTRVVLVSGPNTGVGIPALVWQDIGGPCQSLFIGAGGEAAIGPCGAPHTGLPLLEERDRPAEWTHFFNRFRPFAYRDSTRQVSFQGRGNETASPAWQRAVLNWATLQWAELQGGRSGAAYGRALTARRLAEDQPDACHLLEVADYGAALLSTAVCEGGEGEESKTGWIEDEAWEQFDTWMQELAHTSVAGDSIQFMGAGTREPDEAEQDSIRQWVDEVIDTLTEEADPQSPE